MVEMAFLGWLGVYSRSKVRSLFVWLACASVVLPQISLSSERKYAAPFGIVIPFQEGIADQDVTPPGDPFRREKFLKVGIQCSSLCTEAIQMSHSKSSTVVSGSGLRSLSEC
ncbi:hypothetical protein FPQ18DRAFT_322340 [Pyronema domesticum]|nr:hypothetical protein FPQ18DRAFT_322340 [Pyronema domesticum]